MLRVERREAEIPLLGGDIDACKRRMEADGIVLGCDDATGVFEQLRIRDFGPIDFTPVGRLLAAAQPSVVRFAALDTGRILDIDRVHHPYACSQGSVVVPDNLFDRGSLGVRRCEKQAALSV